MTGWHRRQPGRHRGIERGRHRRPPLHQTIKATGGAVAGAAVLGTAAATAGTAVALTSAFLTPAGSHFAAPVVTGPSTSGATGPATGGRTTVDGAEPGHAAAPAGNAPGAAVDGRGGASGPASSRDPQRDRDRPRDTAASTGPAVEPRTDRPSEPATERDGSSGTSPRTAGRDTNAPEPGTEPAGTPGASRPGRSEPDAALRSPVGRSVQPSVRPEYRGRGRVTARKVIKFALTQVGVREDAQGRTKYQEWYAGSARARETAFRSNDLPSAYATAPWCDMFISWLGDQTGTSGSLGSDAYTVAHARWFFSEGRWGYRPRPGAVAFFAWDPPWLRDLAHVDHVGLVVRNNGDGTITTVEGNSYNAVQLRIRPVTWVVGYGYPEFAD